MENKLMRLKKSEFQQKVSSFVLSFMSLALKKIKQIFIGGLLFLEFNGKFN